jgi:hypothetical protein
MRRPGHLVQLTFIGLYTIRSLPPGAAPPLFLQHGHAPLTPDWLAEGNLVRRLGSELTGITGKLTGNFAEPDPPLR